MARLKQFGIYIILFIALYVVTSVLAYLYIANLYKDITDYEILANSPEITILESKKTYINGYVLGTVKNNTGNDIAKEYIRIDFYNKSEHYMGTKYVGLNDFKNGETLEFKANFRYENITSYKVSFEDTPTALPEDNPDNLPWYWFCTVTGVVLFFYYVF